MRGIRPDVGGMLTVLAAATVAALLAATCATAGESATAFSADPAPAPLAIADRRPVIMYAAESGKGTWARLDGPSDNLSSRELFSYALALAEAGRDTDRIGRLLELAGRMQDRDPASPGYGNFRWSWSNDRVMDYNAVEFTMQGGALLWLRHSKALADADRRRLRDILDLAVEGCLRHRVRPSYTNIALMNAQNLILLGEALDRPDVADEGYARLDRIVMHTHECGISEYGSPTYYGVDLDCLGLMETFAGRQRGREQARALLELFWTDIAANFFPPSGRLAGPHSRDYDYLRGHGIIENHLWMAGWLRGEPRGGLGALWPALARWQPPGRLYEMSRTAFPRLVRQAWNTDPAQSRTHYLLADVTLGSAGANYHNMDLPLTVDLPGDASMPRCYFLPDARGDPYGQVKIREGAGPHSKTLHLRPFWAAAQRTADALGLVLYRDEEMTRSGLSLQSHFVLPRAVDGFWIGSRQVTLDGRAPASLEVKTGEPLVIRKGTAAVGIRVIWAMGVTDARPAIRLIDDGNSHGVVRLTVTHFEGSRPAASVVGAGAALWVRVGGGLDTDERFQVWRDALVRARAEVSLAEGRIRAAVAGQDGPVSVEAGFPDGKAVRLDPAPSRAVLELDGRDVGRPILEAVEPLKSYRAFLKQAPVVVVDAEAGTAVEAEAGFTLAPMAVGRDAAASAGAFVWTPGQAGGKGGGSGQTVFILRLPRNGDYCFWGRVISPTPEDDSFYVAVGPEDGPADTVLQWHTGVHEQWSWVPLTESGSKQPRKVRLPQGTVRLEIRTREDGTKLDRLFIGSRPDALPPAPATASASDR